MLAGVKQRVSSISKWSKRTSSQAQQRSNTAAVKHSSGQTQQRSNTAAVKHSSGQTQQRSNTAAEKRFVVDRAKPRTEERE